MSFKKASYANQEQLKNQVQAARGAINVDLVLRDAQYLDVFGGEFVSGDIAVHGQHIVGVRDSYERAQEVHSYPGCYVVPGFIDAHVHIESSMMTPVRFQEAVLPLGTTTVIWDPHEIANVKGTAGIQWALDASEGLQLDFMVMVPSCVPSTSPELGLESSGAVLRPKDLRPFRAHPRVLGLAEMMNFPGLLGGDAEVLEKLEDFQSLKRDGHCPGLTGKDLNAYGAAGIHSCHESTAKDEAREKLGKGVHVLIREGSCAKDADALLPLLTSYSSAVLGLCTDDRNPLDIEDEGHVSCIVTRALRAGHAPADVFRAASFAAAKMFGLEDRGALAPGLLADMVVVKLNQPGDWRAGLSVVACYKGGKKVDPLALKKLAGLSQGQAFAGGNLRLPPLSVETFALPAASAKGEGEVRVIGVIPNQIVTEHLTASLAVSDGQLRADPARDLLKIAVLERHHGTGRHSVAVVKGFGLQKGAIATSVNHDSHNVIVVGVDDQAMLGAVKALQEIDGGIVVWGGPGRVAKLPLPIGGLMSDASPSAVAAELRRLKALAKELGCILNEPFLQLSFLALPVIPALKITDRGLVDVGRFQLVPVCTGE